MRSLCATGNAGVGSTAFGGLPVVYCDNTHENGAQNDDEKKTHESTVRRRAWPGLWMLLMTWQLLVRKTHDRALKVCVLAE